VTAAEASAAADLAPTIVTSDALDTGAHAALQQRVFGHVLEDNDIPLERLGEPVFSWKLAPPRGPARLALIEDRGAILSSCTGFPVELASGDRRVRGWHLCDAVSAPEARGRGLFTRALTALRDDTAPDEWLFAFPNGQSRPAFERQGFVAVEHVPLWVRPVIGRGGAPPDAVAPITAFGPAHDALASRLAADRGLTAERSAAYLTWRYLAHPFFDYQCFELRREDRVDGILVLNRMQAAGRTSLWVMELLAVDRAGERELARAARAVAGAQGCDVVLSMASARLPGALRLPPVFLPKKHILMVRSGGPGEPRPPGEWEVHTGDWDTF